MPFSSDERQDMIGRIQLLQQVKAEMERRKRGAMMQPAHGQESIPREQEPIPMASVNPNMPPGWQQQPRTATTQQIIESIPPGESLIGNVGRDLARLPFQQMAFAEQIATDPVGAVKGFGEFLGEGARISGALQGIPEPEFQRKRREQLGGREITRKSALQQLHERPLETAIQVTAPIGIAAGLLGKIPKLRSKFGGVKELKQGVVKELESRAVSGKSPESAIAKWDQEITRQFEQQPKVAEPVGKATILPDETVIAKAFVETAKPEQPRTLEVPKPQEAPDALQKAQAPQAKAQEIAPPKQPWEMTSEEYANNQIQSDVRLQAMQLEGYDITAKTFVKEHTDLIRAALKKGENVPDVVLADYPSLQKSVAQKSPGREKWQITKKEWMGKSTGEGRRTMALFHDIAVKKAVEQGKPVPAEVLAEYPELGKGEAVSQNFTQFAIEKKLATDYDITDHGGLSPSGKRTKIGEKRRTEGTLRRIRENEQAHKLFEEAIERGEVVDPSGEVTKKGLRDAATKRQSKKAESRISIIDTKIKDIENLGSISHMKNGKLRKGFQSQVDNLLIEKKELQIKIGAQPPKPKGKIVEMEAGPSFIGKAIKRTAGDILDIGKKILISGEARGKSKPYKGLVESMRRVNDTHGPVRDAFIEKLREGGVWKLRLNPKKSVELGEFLIQGKPPPKGHPLHETAMGYYRAVQAAFRALRKQGVQVRARGTYGRTGKMRPIGEVPNYFPRRLQAKIKEQLFEEAVSLVERAQADLPGAEMKGLARGIDAKTEAGTIATLNRLMENYAPQYADFKSVLEYRISTGLSKTKGKAVFDIFRMTGPDIYRRGTLEHGRTLDFPIPMYDTDVVRVMSGYADELGRVVGEVKEWGPFRQKIVHQLADIAAESPKEGQTAIQMVRQFMGTAEGLSGTTKKLAERYVNLAVARKIGLGTATIPNLFQTGISTVMLGFKPTLQGAGALLTKGGRKQARLSSSPYGDFIRNYYGTDVSNVSLSRQAARFTTTANGFQMVNRFNKALGALTMRYKLPQLHKWANLPVRKIAGKGKMGELLSRRAYGKSMLKKLGVDLAKPLTEDVIIRASHRFTTEAQLMKNVIHEPLWMTSPQWKPLSLFKSFIYKQLKFTKDYVIKEAHRNPMPLVRLIASGIGAGELIVQAKELLRETLTGEERKRKAQSLVERAAFDLAASATFGIATEVFDAFDPYETPGGQKRGVVENALSKLAFLIQPILLDELYKIASMSKKFAVDVGEEGFTPKEAALRQGKSAAYIAGSIPGALFKGQMSKKVRESSIRKLLRDAGKATNKEARKKKESAAKSLQTKWNKQHPNEQINIL